MYVEKFQISKMHKYLLLIPFRLNISSHWMCHNFVHNADMQNKKIFHYNNVKCTQQKQKESTRHHRVKARHHVPNYNLISGVNLEFISSSTTFLRFCPLACWGSFTGGIRRAILLDLSEFSHTAPGLAMNFLGKELLDREVEEELQPGKRPDDV